MAEDDEPDVKDLAIAASKDAVELLIRTMMDSDDMAIKLKCAIAVLEVGGFISWQEPYDA